VHTADGEAAKPRTDMLIISWNMGCGPRSRYRRTHAEAWRYLLELKPDVAFVQEALRISTPPTTSGDTFWSADQGTDSGTAVFVRRGIVAEPVTLRSAGSYVAGASVQSPSGLFLLTSVHVGPRNYRKNRQMLAEQLIKVTAGRRFVVGGDLNAARHWDAVYGGRTHTQFFKVLADSGFHDCHWAQHGREIQSFWGHQTREAYQCDHFFTDKTTAERGEILNCVVLDNPQVRALSDHGPLRLELAIDVDDNG
jgi:endonuclease/exonuclease/phosphatase family metal-dependent hydrolase